MRLPRRLPTNDLAVSWRPPADVTAVAQADPTLRDRLASMGQVLYTGPASEFRKLVEDQSTRAADAARILGIKAARH
jgi:hypothetical protein